MKPGVRRADEGTERREPQLFVQLQLACRPRHDGQIVALPVPQFGYREHQPPEDPGVAVFSPDGEQSQFARRAMRRQVGVEVGELGVERERALVAHRGHPDQAIAVHSDDVGVVGVEAVDQAPLGIGWMLGDLLDERRVVQAVDLLEFPLLGRDSERQGRWSHLGTPPSQWEIGHEPPGPPADRCSAVRMLRRWANRIRIAIMAHPALCASV